MAGGVRWRNRQNPPSDADVRAVPSGHREPWQAPAAQEKSSSGNFPPSQLRRFFDLDFFSKSNDDFGLRRFFRKNFEPGDFEWAAAVLRGLQRRTEGCQGSRGRRERGHRDRNRSSMRRALSDLDVFFEKTLSPVISIGLRPC